MPVCLLWEVSLASRSIKFVDISSFFFQNGFRIQRYRIPNFLSVVVGFRIPRVVFRISKPRNPDFTSKNFPDSGIWILLHGAK